MVCFSRKHVPEPRCRCGRFWPIWCCTSPVHSQMLVIWRDRRRYAPIRHIGRVLMLLRCMDWSSSNRSLLSKIRRRVRWWSRGWCDICAGNSGMFGQEVLQHDRGSRQVVCPVLGRDDLRWSMQLLGYSNKEIGVVRSSPWQRMWLVSAENDVGQSQCNLCQFRGTAGNEIPMEQ